MVINDSWNTLMLNETQLKEGSLINGNVDVHMLRPILKTVQELYLERLLGTSLYLDLQSKIKLVNAGNAGALSVEERYLLDRYIAPILCWAVMKEPMYLSFKYMNKGIERQNSDESQAPSLQDLQFIADNAQNKFDYYSERLVEYLEANKSSYLKYRDETNCNDIRPAVTGFNSRLAMGSGQDDYASCKQRRRFYYK